MPWNEVMVRVARDAVAGAEQCLGSLGALAVTLEDEADHPVLEPGPGETPLWPTVSVRGLFDASTDRVGVTDALQALAGSHRPGHVSWRTVDDQDWARAWMDRFEPMQFGEHLWVVPSGMKGPDDPAAVQMNLDPGLAFGTGTHPTTALCLEWLAGQDLAGFSVLDFGCGSGILAIAAAKLGAVELVAVDNDPQALDATRSNAAHNRVDGRIHCQAPEEFSAGEFNVTVANILAGPLVDLAPLLVERTAPGGRLLLSGLLEEQVEWVSGAYLSSCKTLEITTRDGWSRVVFERND